MPVERNHVRTTGRAIRDLLTKDIDVRALLNSRVTIVQKVRRSTLWLHWWIFRAKNNELVSQNVHLSVNIHCYFDLTNALSQPGNIGYLIAISTVISLI